MTPQHFGPLAITDLQMIHTTKKQTRQLCEEFGNGKLGPFCEAGICDITKGNDTYHSLVTVSPGGGGGGVPQQQLPMIVTPTELSLKRIGVRTVEPLPTGLANAKRFGRS